MAARISRLKPFVKSVTTKFDIRSTFAHTNRCYDSTDIKFSGVLGSHYKSNSVNVLMGNSGYWSTKVSFSGIAPLVNCRLFSSTSESRSKAAEGSDIIADSSSFNVWRTKKVALALAAGLKTFLSDRKWELITLAYGSVVFALTKDWVLTIPVTVVLACLKPIDSPRNVGSDQIVQPFSVGDTNEDQWLPIVQTIGLKIEGIYKISQIREDINSMMRVHPNVSLEREPPRCLWSRIEITYAELTIRYNLKNMNKESRQKEEILVEVAEIMKQHGAQIVFLEFETLIWIK